MNKLLDSFLEYECPWHDTAIFGKKTGHKVCLKLDSLFCDNCGIWDLNRINRVISCLPSLDDSILHQRLVLLKEYYEKQTA
jgi:hypothetical protein